MIEINIPGSKSITQRALVCSALAEGRSIIKNPLLSEDTLLLSNGLKKLGVEMKTNAENIVVYGKDGKFSAKEENIYMGNNGTGFRFLTTLANFNNGVIVLTGNDRMKERPIGDLVNSLQNIGARIDYIEKSGFPPVKIEGRKSFENKIEIDVTKSSQFLSSVLLASPLFKNGLTVYTKGKKVSKPYIDITINVMKHFGVNVSENNASYSVAGNCFYKNREFIVESDFSSASYFIAAAYFLNKIVLIKNLNYNKSLQGDKNFINILQRMGGKFKIENNQITIFPVKLRGVETDMSELPDMVPTLAVLSSVADGETVIKNIQHLRYKETDRIETVVKNLVKCGINAAAGKDFIKIEGNKVIKRSVIDPENDHRIAMSFALLSFLDKDIKILNKDCVKKSFPNFWEEFKKLH